VVVSLQCTYSMITPNHNRDYGLPLQGRWYPIVPSRVCTSIRGMYAAVIKGDSGVHTDVGCDTPEVTSHDQYDGI